MRDMLARHQIAVCVVLFAAALLALKLWVLPQIFQSYGYLGLALLVAAAFAWAFWHESRRPIDPGS